MKPRILDADASPEFTVNQGATAYVEVLQEWVLLPNPANQPANMRMVYVNEKQGRANWFDRADYVLTFRLEGPDGTGAVPVGVEFDGRIQHRQWRVKPAV